MSPTGALQRTDFLGVHFLATEAINEETALLCFDSFAQLTVALDMPHWSRFVGLDILSNAFLNSRMYPVEGFKAVQTLGGKVRVRMRRLVARLDWSSDSGRTRPSPEPSARRAERVARARLTDFRPDSSSYINHGASDPLTTATDPILRGSWSGRDAWSALNCFSLSASWKVLRIFVMKINVFHQWNIISVLCVFWLSFKTIFSTYHGCLWFWCCYLGGSMLRTEPWAPHNTSFRKKNIDLIPTFASQAQCASLPVTGMGVNRHQILGPPLCYVKFSRLLCTYSYKKWPTYSPRSHLIKLWQIHSLWISGSWTLQDNQATARKYGLGNWTVINSCSFKLLRHQIVDLETGLIILKSYHSAWLLIAMINQCIFLRKLHSIPDWIKSTSYHLNWPKIWFKTRWLFVIVYQSCLKCECLADTYLTLDQIVQLFIQTRLLKQIWSNIQLNILGPLAWPLSLFLKSRGVLCLTATLCERSELGIHEQGSQFFRSWGLFTDCRNPSCGMKNPDVCAGPHQIVVERIHLHHQKKSQRNGRSFHNFLLKCAHKICRAQMSVWPAFMSDLGHRPNGSSSTESIETVWRIWVKRTRGCSSLQVPFDGQ